MQALPSAVVYTLSQAGIRLWPQTSCAVCSTLSVPILEDFHRSPCVGHCLNRGMRLFKKDVGALEARNCTREVDERSALPKQRVLKTYITNLVPCCQLQWKGSFLWIG